MRRINPFLFTILIFAILPLGCNERQSENAQGSELELAGDEPDENIIKNTETLEEYNPGDTVVNIPKEELPVYLRDHLQVVVSAYLDIEEALVESNPELAQEKAQQLVDVMLRHEQENMDLNPQVKEFYTSAAHMIRQGAENILGSNEMWEIRSNFSSMAPAAYKMAKVADIKGKTLYYKYCTETFNNRGAFWLSRSEEIKNPYAGKEQLNCGKILASF